MKITILLSTYNGEKYLKEQLDSLFELNNSSDISILVRDDGSSDSTLQILEEYKNKHPNLSYYQGENKKPAKSFWELLNKAEESDYFAFCDQDDVWDKDKLEIAINELEKKDKSKPLLYFSDVRIVDQNLKLVSNTMVSKDIDISYPLSIFNNIAPGCTFVFNNKLREIAIKYDVNKNYINIHDWLMYMIASCFGEAIFDKSSHMSYRQHGDNSIGAIKNKLKYFIKQFVKRKDIRNINVRQKMALGMENTYSSLMSEENRYLTSLVAHYINNKDIKKKLLSEKRLQYKKKQYKFFRYLIKHNEF